MATLTELSSCDGFTVEGPEGCLSWVEETWLDAGEHPAAFAIRTCDGRRALLAANTIQAVDADAQELLVAAGAKLRELAPPHLEREGDDPIATWRPGGGSLTLAAAPAHAPPTAPALAAARTTTASHERRLVATILLAFGCLATLVAVEIGLAFGIAYLITGRIT